MNSTEKLALTCRLETAKLILNRGYGHLGSLSIVETLAVIFEKYMEDPQERSQTQNSVDRNWFILSKGHSSASYYSILALKGYFKIGELKTFNQNNSRLPSHPVRTLTPGVDCTSGSLGQGISQAVGIALGLKQQNMNHKVFCIIGDGECNEGEVWEAFYAASKFKLNNLLLFIDNNRKQSDGETNKISVSIDFKKIAEAFDFNYYNINGHSVTEIDTAIKDTENNSKCSMIVLNTIKGKGIKEFESLKNNHHLKINDNAKEVALKNYIEQAEKMLKEEKK